MKTRSIITQVLVAILLIFVLMLGLYSMLMARKQAQLANETEQLFLEYVLQSEEEDMALIIDEQALHTTTEYRAYSTGVIAGTTLLGSALFIIIIRRIIKPLTELTETVRHIDVQSIPTVQEKIQKDNMSSEIRALATSFDQALQKIYDDYEKQKQFSANVAHELRTPLAIMQTKIDVFQKKNSGDAHVTAFVDTMHHSVQRLTHLVEEILLLQKEQAPRQEQVELAAFVDSVMFDYEDKAQEKDIALATEGVRLELVTDALLLERVVANLLDNAIKYTQSGGAVTVEWSVFSGQVRLHVKDNGPGMDDDTKKRAFDLFYRGDPSRSRNTGGYGIGLALVKDLTERLGGTIVIADNAPQGTDVIVTLPLQENDKR